MLSPSGKKYNELSDKLRKELQAKKQKLGQFAKFKFAIAKKNPEYNFIDIPEASIRQTAAPEYIFPMQVDIQPVTYTIRDYDNKDKKIGLIAEENEKGEPIGFRRITVKERDRGVLKLDLNTTTGEDDFAYLMLHPRTENGIFYDDKQGPLIKLVDEKADAKKYTEIKSQKADAMYVATKMDDADVRDFACAMNWDEDEDVDILKGRVIDMAENNTPEFVKFVETAEIKKLAVIKRAESAGVIKWLPLDYKYAWGANGQTIVAFGRKEDMNPLREMADWLITAKNGAEVFKKLENALRPAKV